MGIIDSLVGIGVVLILIYFIYKKMADKNPSIREKVSEFSPTNRIGGIEMPEAIKSLEMRQKIM